MVETIDIVSSPFPARLTKSHRDGVAKLTKKPEQSGERSVKTFSIDVGLNDFAMFVRVVAKKDINVSDFTVWRGLPFSKGR